MSTKQGDGTIWLVQSESMDNVAEAEVAGGEAAALTRVGPGENRSNEDAAAIVATGSSAALLAVADGFGGAPAGERASWLAASEIAEAACSGPTDEKTQRALILDGFESANRKILELGIGAATTLAAVGIEDGVARPFHCGDSTILVVGGRGKIKWRTVAHSPAGYAVASGWVGEREAREHDEAQVVSNYLGSPEMRIEVGPEIQLAPHDTVLLASDGLTDNLSLERVAATLTRQRPLTEAVEDLASQAGRRMTTDVGKPDDVTVIAFRPRKILRS